jgi:hypothetical protein
MQATVLFCKRQILYLKGLKMMLGRVERAGGTVKPPTECTGKRMTWLFPLAWVGKGTKKTRRDGAGHMFTFRVL